MVNIKHLFPPTTTKVNMNTKAEINNRIQQKTENNIKNFYGKNKEEIDTRIKELDFEWDTERVLEINFASIVLLTSILGLFNKRWITLSGIASVFMIQHSLQGWCPPLPIIRKLGVRTATEIQNEKTALKVLKERFSSENDRR
ncbi:DUF2892 domain-containing protein [Cytobacillus sp. S13-E01]|uniref:DUF2892 domain-containing protein n=1 Tax=Cytobacillus sp. S13-E01 TaxID=3031326 RepID=UPI0023D80DEC|nr:DUF2892 domain-containing protein [Cytobacillus sp. S13-E01]MDF0728636.1 DUF2892 domain-containing protein [Cytobacillus sp. S13-E01]